MKKSIPLILALICFIILIVFGVLSEDGLFNYLNFKAIETIEADGLLDKASKNKETNDFDCSYKYKVDDKEYTLTVDNVKKYDINETIVVNKDNPEQSWLKSNTPNCDDFYHTIVVIVIFFMISIVFCLGITYTGKGD